MKRLKSLKIYLMATILLFSWWSIAFKNIPQFTNQTPMPSLSSSGFPKPPNLDDLSNMDRELIKSALNGDMALMAHLIADWDLDAQIMENQGYIGVTKLSRLEFMRAQVIGRQLKQSQGEELEKLREANRLPYLYDDAGRYFSLKTPMKKFLPQTYVSGSFLLALSDPDSIVALPSGLRHQKQLYSKTLTDKVPDDLNRYDSERYYIASPDIAFTAYYSLPTTLQTLKNQNIPIFTIDELNSVEAISCAITRVGNTINRALEAELMTLFIKSALISLDNRLSCLTVADHWTQKPEKILYLTYFSQYSIPTGKTLTGKLLKRLEGKNFMMLLADGEESWPIPIAHEEIVSFNPDLMIIATMDGQSLDTMITQELSFASLSAIQKGNLRYVDSTIQHYPSQFLVLAYYDLVNSIASTVTP